MSKTKGERKKRKDRERQGDRAAHMGAEGKRTPGNKPEKLGGGGEEMDADQDKEMEKEKTAMGCKTESWEPTAALLHTGAAPALQFHILHTEHPPAMRT